MLSPALWTSTHLPSSSSIIPVPCDQLAPFSHIKSVLNDDYEYHKNLDSSLGAKLGSSMPIRPAVGARILFALESQSFLFPE